MAEQPSDLISSGTGNGGGTGGGGVVGWLLGGNATKGMLSGPQTGAYQRGYLQDDFLKRQAPMMNTTNADQARGQQGQLAQMLFQQATGQRQGAGELAVQRQAGNAMAQQTSQAQMARGANSALAGRAAARMNAEIGTNAAGQAGIAQMQDQQAAQNQLGGLLGMQRGQDIQTAGANQQSQLAQQQLQLSALAQMLGVDEAALRQDQAKRAIQATDKGNLATLLQVGGQVGAAAASDRNLKTDISEDAGAEVDDILRNLSPKAYRYKDERHGKGRRVGIMAQDLERSWLGADIVEDTPDGKMLDVNKALSLALAAVARLDARVRELENRG